MIGNDSCPPLDLWLQWHGDGTPDDAGEVCETEVTWSREKVFNHDVEYVHADEIRRALMGHRCSELWGDTGLIAATMRCVDAVDSMGDELSEAWHLLNVLSANMMDDGPTWPRVLEWLERNKSFRPKSDSSP